MRNKQKEQQVENGFAKSTPNVFYILRLEKVLNVSVGEMFEEDKEGG